ncbi:MAG: cell wall-binding repeat-containing protein, partial [Firmicutes bacterium]|nr:cell wall-binding repeat-containing protein [Bacillota bacterium]
RNFPDGLAGGPLALTTEGPLLLVTDDNWQYADLALSARNLGSRFLFVLGGPTLISDETIWKILERDESPDGPVGGPEL